MTLETCIVHTSMPLLTAPIGLHAGIMPPKKRARAGKINAMKGPNLKQKRLEVDENFNQQQCDASGAADFQPNVACALRLLHRRPVCTHMLMLIIPSVLLFACS